MRIPFPREFATSQFERLDAFNGFPINNLSNLITGNYLIKSSSRSRALFISTQLFHSRTIRLFLSLTFV